MVMRMWEWWRAVGREYREKRKREDEQLREERRERARRRTPYEAEMESRKYRLVPFEELSVEMERRWGVEVDWEELGIERPRPRGVNVVVEIAEKRPSPKGQEGGHGGLAEGALMIVLTGKFRSE